MEKVIIDGTDAVLGRLGSFVSKELLKGKEVVLINCEKIIVSGSKADFVENIRRKRRMGQGGSMKGPKYIRKSDMLVKRILRGMLPWDRTRGREAHKRLRCEIGIGDLSEEQVTGAKKFNHQKPQRTTYMSKIVEALK
jgi:large subunit ribosomal protein L13